MHQRCKLIGLLTPLQSELLKALYDLHGQTGPTRYWRPKDLGAFRSSHHALTLRRLLEHGFVERALVSALPNARNYGYRITTKGCEAWSLFLEISVMSTRSLFGGSSARERVSALQRLAA